MKLLLSFLLLPTLTWQLTLPPESCPIHPLDSCPCTPCPNCSISNAAPNDYIARCATDDPQYTHCYPPNWRVLMDSINYLELIDDNDGVWQRLDVDGTGTVWQQAGGICAHEVSVCEIGTNRNNWFFTQYICYLDAGKVFVNVTYAFTGCVSQFSCEPQVTFHLYERNDTDAAAARDPNNYEPFPNDTGIVIGRSGFGINLGNTVLNFTRSNNATRGFYIGVQDTGSCVSIRRLTIYYDVAAGGMEGVTVIPEIALPPWGSTESSIGVACCLPNAVPVPGTSLEIECDANGVCTNDPECVCRRGYEFTTANGEAECRACPMNTYQARDSNDFSCEPCPANSEARNTSTAVCPCLFNFNRPRDQPDEPCTRPPSSPRVAIRNPPIVSNTSITVCWLPSLETGGRDDLHYNIYLLRFGGGSNAYQRVLTVNSAMNADPNTILCGTIRNLTTSNASYSVVITAANGATDDPETFTDVSVVQDRFIIFYFTTGGFVGFQDPSSPRVPITDPAVVNDTSITICWLPSLNTGEGSDLQYNIYLLEFGDGNSAYQRVMTVNSNINADLNTPLCRTIGDLTPGTRYSVVITAANGATDDPDSFTDVSVFQDRFIVFQFETLSSPSPSPSPPPPTESTEDDGLQLDLVIGVLIFAILVTAIVTAIITLLVAWCVHKRSMSKHDLSSRKKNGATSGSSFKKSAEMTTNPAYGY